MKIVLGMLILIFLAFLGFMHYRFSKRTADRLEKILKGGELRGIEIEAEGEV
ncbi:MAG: hypothetical protein ABIK53_05075 [bacterium]